MLMIRLQRVGRRNHAEFRVVVTEHTRAAKSANYLEMVGHYNPHTDAFTVQEDRLKHWMENGAQVSDTLHNLLVTNGVIKGEKKNVLPKKTPIVKEEEPKEVEKKGDDAKSDDSDASDTKKEDASKEEEAEAVEKKTEE